MTDEEKRIIRRRRVLKSAKIIFAEGTTVVDCVIRNLSITGARLEVPLTVGIPHEFTLFDAHANRHYRARIAWRRGDAVGVEFLDDPEPDDDA